MKTDIDSVNTLRNATPYIRQHSNKTAVISLSSDVLDSTHFAALIQDIAIVHTLGLKVVLVFGASQQTDSEMLNQGMTIEKHDGLRVTSAETLALMQGAVGALRYDIEALLSSAVTAPMLTHRPLSVVSGNFVLAKPLGVIEGVDYQFAGSVRSVNAEAIADALKQNNIVLLSAMCPSPSGALYNVPHQSVAIEVAAALKADKLVLAQKEVDELPSHVESSALPQLISQHPAMQATLASIESALARGLDRVHLISSEEEGALLLEVYTRNGAGTVFESNAYERFRGATVKDLHEIEQLIRPLESRGVLVHRPLQQLESDIAQFHVLEQEQKVVACVSLTMYDRACELACFVVDAQFSSKGRGKRLLAASLAQAKAAGATQVFALSTQSADWFMEQGFEPVDAAQLPKEKLAHIDASRNSKVLMLNV